jgi:hypothetical protein
MLAMQPFRFTIRQLLEATTWAAVEFLCLREAALTMRGPVYLLAALAIWLVGGTALGICAASTPSRNRSIR